MRRIAPLRLQIHDRESRLLWHWHLQIDKRARLHKQVVVTSMRLRPRHNLLALVLALDV